MSNEQARRISGENEELAIEDVGFVSLNDLPVRDGNW